MRDYNLGNHISDLRKKCNLTQEDVAYKLGITDKAVSKWENGSAKPSIKNLQLLAKVFDISLDELLTIKGEEGVEKKISKIVLTGGPCAGKSTAMNWIQNFFQKKGYYVIFIPETASELIIGGVAPWTTFTNADFQDCVLNLQIQKEKIFEAGALSIPSDKILIVCDRGALDGKAYMSNRDFNYILKKNNFNEIELRDNYDAVFHLVTAAKGAEKFYNLDNAARTETIEQARNLDEKLLQSWTGHPHLRVVDNSTDFEQKMKRLLTEISNFLGEPEPYEIERKFLIEYPDVELLKSLPNCEKVEIVQTYLKSNPNEEVRIRQRGLNGHYTYSETKKININSKKRIEIETRLTQQEYVSKLFNADPTKNQIIKERYCLAFDNQYFEIDLYPFWSDKAIAEIELDDENQAISFPEYIKVIKEVTDDMEYRNVSLARKLAK